MKAKNILFIIILAALIIGSGVYLWQTTIHVVPVQTKNLPSTSQSMPSAGYDSTTGWKTYENEDLGISFKYPADWQTIQLNKQGNIVNFLAGTVYSSGTDTSVNYFDPGQIFFFAFYSKDFEEYEGSILNKKSVDVNWTTSQFAANMGVGDIADILFTKKLSEKSMLVALYESPECSPMMRLVILTPFSEAYPNFEISISTSAMQNDPIIKAEEAQQAAQYGAACNLRAGYQKVAAKILANTYSEEMNKNIETARLIADSLVSTK
ncbi:MAG: hypothetical protein WC675_04185 [Patescibacteria group bacterium]|jgi:hypothetical protein